MKSSLNANQLNQNYSMLMWFKNQKYSPATCYVRAYSKLIAYIRLIILQVVVHRFHPLKKR